jgi:cell wall-associated NlpC family hydrolase
MMAWRAGGKKLPHNAAMQYAATKRVAKADLLPGDIVFFLGLDHCGMYLGNDEFIEAPHTGDVVKIVKLSTYGHYVGAGRP